MERPTVSIIAAALVAAAAAAAAATTGVVTVSGLGEVTGAPLVAAAPPVATQLLPGAATEGLIPRTVGPQRPHGALSVPAGDTAEPAAAPDAAAGSRTVAGGTLLAATGESADPIADGGSTVRFSVEVEASTELDPDVVAELVEEALYDARSWASDFDLRRTSPDDAWMHVVVAEPGTVDTLCGRAGLNTAGWLSCWTGDTAAINVDRWTHGVAHFDDLAQYRRYVVSHEVGHGLGYGHRDCPGSGSLAPLMQQQTKSLEGCVANEWRHP